jgi:hypothetical protein
MLSITRAVWLVACSLVLVGCSSSNDKSDAAVGAPDLSMGDLGRGPKQCGSLICVVGEACLETVYGAPPPDGGWPTQHSCVRVPSACAASPTCACLEQHGGSAAFCNANAQGSVQCAPSNGPDGMADIYCPGI